MAIPSYVQVVPATGKGDGTIAVTCLPYEGRTTRTGTITVTTTTGTGVSASCTVNQSGSDFFRLLAPSEAVTLEANASSRIISFNGKSNAVSLNWDLISKDSTFPINSSVVKVSVNDDIPISSNVNIPGDPGKNASYTFAGTIDLTSYKPGVDVTLIFSIGTNVTTAVGVSILVKASTGTISVSPTTLTFSNAGTPAKNVVVTSNTTWKVS